MPSCRWRVCVSWMLLLMRGNAGLAAALAMQRDTKQSASLSSPFLDYSPLVIANVGRVGVRVRPEVTQGHKGLAASVSEFDAFSGGFVTNENLILRQFAEADHCRSLQVECTYGAGALHGNQAGCAVVLDCYRDSGLDGQFLGAEQLQ